MKISDEFQRSMNWVHTWFGIAVSTILFCIFWTGTLSVFDREIDQWMIPETRIVPPDVSSFDETALPYFLSADVELGASIFMRRPDARNPTFRIDIIGEDSSEVALHPESGSKLELTDTLGGTGFFYPFHYYLHIDWMGIGVWIVGVATMGMLVLMISGIFIHRKLISDFFTFRPNNAIRRSSLDLHNLSSVLVLPFHFLIAFSGLVVYGQIYFGWAAHTVYGGDQLAERQDQGFYFRSATGQPGAPLVSLDSLVVTSEANWNLNAGKEAWIDADQVNIMHYGDINSYITVQSLFPSRGVGLAPAAVDYDASTGQVLNTTDRRPVTTGFLWVAGFHFVQFDHWPLRWLYFGAGLAGCVMIASGLIYWVKARVRRAEFEPRYIRTVRALTIGFVTGVVVSSGSFLVANRILPRDASFAAYDRSDLEVWIFFVVWVLTFIHAGLRNTKAWSDQAGAIGFTAILAVILNWVTTGDHLLKTTNEGLWSVAGMDLVLIATAAVAIASVFRIKKTERILASDNVKTQSSEQIGIK